jgi:hypothetical protein
LPSTHRLVPLRLPPSPRVAQVVFASRRPCKIFFATILVWICIILSPFKNIRCFSFIKLMYLDIFYL